MAHSSGARVQSLTICASNSLAIRRASGSKGGRDLKQRSLAAQLWAHCKSYLLLSLSITLETCFSGSTPNYAPSVYWPMNVSATLCSALLKAGWRRAACGQQVTSCESPCVPGAHRSSGELKARVAGDGIAKLVAQRALALVVWQLEQVEAGG